MKKPRAWIEGKHLVILVREGGALDYDPLLTETREPYWLDHMRDKRWFTREVEAEVLAVLGKTEADWPDAARSPFRRASECDDSRDRASNPLNPRLR